MRVHEFTVLMDYDQQELIQISNLASRFISQIIIMYTDQNDNEHVIDVKSLLGMILQPIHAGTLIRLSTRGKDELEALETLIDSFSKLPRLEQEQ
ncbi:HPr family phosphocarrier protein [Neobacillus mesonae]|nr:HPr family phosphocarrier protein [Neobacillus mesonae]